jgi:hypothetical protein
MLADGFVGIRNHPATKAEFAAGIFFGPARGLNYAIQTDEHGNKELAHDVLQVDGPDRSVDTTNDSPVDRQPAQRPTRAGRAKPNAKLSRAAKRRRVELMLALI